MTTPSIPIWRRVLYASLVTIGTFAAAEAGLRLAWPIARTATLPDGIIRRHIQGTALYYDPDLYWTREPGGPGNSDDSINAFNFRRRVPMTAEHPPDRMRAIALGDSQTLGAGVEDDETYSAVAEARSGWEVLNAGISGYRSLQVYRLLRLKMARFDPDVIVVDCWPHDSPRDDGPLVGTPEGWRARAGELWFSSRVVRLLKIAAERLRPDRRRMRDDAPTGSSAEGNLPLITDWARANGIVPVLLTYPVLDEEADTPDCLTRPGELPEGAIVVDACAALAGAGVPGRALFLDRNHMTARGNRLVGEALAEVLRDLGDGP